MGYTFESVPNLKGYAPKKAGRHRWVMIVTYNVTDESLTAAEEGQPSVLDHENIADLGALCIDCEVMWRSGVKRYCPAPDFEK